MPTGPYDGSESLPDPFAVDEDELPAWVDPSPPPLRRPSRSSLRQGGGSEHGHDARRANRAGPLRPRARANRARRAKRRVYLWGGLAAAAAIIAALVVVLLPGSSGQTHAGDGFVSTFQAGELRSVPSACDSVSNSTLTQYLPGPRARVVPPSLSGNAQSQCDWTLDRKPVYRLLAVAAQAYAPNGLATGNGSATSAAKDAYGQAMLALAHPPKATHQPKASITPIGHLGTVAFSAFQVISVGGDTTDRDTVVIRLRNVMITVVFSGLAHARQGGYGPVTASQMMAGAVAAAGDVLGKVG